jgi:hypothetical protein
MTPPLAQGALEALLSGGPDAFDKVSGADAATTKAAFNKPAAIACLIVASNRLSNTQDSSNRRRRF